MADIIVDTYKLDQYAQRLNKVNARLVQLDIRLDALYMRAGLLESWNLFRADARIYYNPRIKKCSLFLERVASDFISVEKLLSSEDPANFIEKSPSKDGWAEIFNKFIGQVGFLGGVVSFLQKPFVRWMDHGEFNLGFTSWTSVAQYAKSGVSWLKGIYKWFDSNRDLNKLSRMLPDQARKTRIKRLFGLNKKFDGHKLRASVAKSWTMRFKNNFRNTLSEELKSYTSGGAKSVFAWLGVGLTALSNSCSNYDEYKSGKISGKRAVAETVTETVIDIGKDLIIGAAVGAAIGTVFSSAPVVLVGAAAVGATYLLDWGCKKITGKLCKEEKGFTEAVSDFVLDVGEKIDTVGKKVVSSAISSLKNGFPKLKLPGGIGFKPLFNY